MISNIVKYCTMVFCGLLEDMPEISAAFDAGMRFALAPVEVFIC